MKVDLCLWTKNGAKTLDCVLKRINKVIPEKAVNQKFIVDDWSTDKTRDIALENGWGCWLNRGHGISDGANTALKHVETEFFCSFEQDLLLATNWWIHISKQIEGDNVAAAEGIRIPDKPSGLHALESYNLSQYHKILIHPEKYSEKKFFEASIYGPTLDNTMYKTEVIKEMGGFPTLPNLGAGTDSFLSHKIISHYGYRWLIDYDTVSTHLRQGLRDQLNHMVWCGKTFPIINREIYRRKFTFTPLIFRLFFSPFRGLEIGVKTKAPSIAYIYPLMRFASFKGITEGYRQHIGEVAL